jgi:hypothetical protein
MSAILPKLKVLNLNYNYFTSLEGLSNMVNLRKLTVVGCRLGGREKGIVKCLKGLSSLEELDLRYVSFARLGVILIIQNESIDAIILSPSLLTAPPCDGINRHQPCRSSASR